MSLGGRPCARGQRKRIEQATPLTEGDRLLRYAIANGDQEYLYRERDRAVARQRLTPRQRRRLHHKAGRALGRSGDQR